MSQSCLEREWLQRLGKLPTAMGQTNAAMAAEFSSQETRGGARLRFDKRDAPSHLRHRLAPA
jgi:hypothetical protein